MSNTTNKKYTAAYAKKAEELELNKKFDDDDAQLEAAIDVFCDTILVGWEGVKKPDGEVVEYSKKAAVNLMTNLPHLYKDLVIDASSLTNFKLKKLEDDSKN